MCKTSCVIGFEYMDGTCKTIHCDYDGYIEYVGSMLLEKYNYLMETLEDNKN